MAVMDEIIEDIYRTLQEFYTRGFEPPAAIGLTRRELAYLFKHEHGRDFDESCMPITLWGHRVILVKG
jgi:hypothetical protein